MTLKWSFFQEIAIIAQQLRAEHSDPVNNTFELHQFAQHVAQLQDVLTLQQYDEKNYVNSTLGSI